MSFFHHRWCQFSLLRSLWPPPWPPFLGPSSNKPPVSVLAPQREGQQFRVASSLPGRSPARSLESFRRDVPPGFPLLFQHLPDLPGGHQPPQRDSTDVSRVWNGFGFLGVPLPGLRFQPLSGQLQLGLLIAEILSRPPAEHAGDAGVDLKARQRERPPDAVTDAVARLYEQPFQRAEGLAGRHDGRSVSL